MIYDVTMLSVSVGQTPAALRHIERALPTLAQTKVYACWYCEIGSVGDILLVRGFENMATLQDERDRMVREGNPFMLGDVLESMSTESYRLFPFLTDMATGRLGPFYEVRVYRTTRDGMSATIDLWRDAIPERIKISPLVAAMYAVDGVFPRFMHIWPFPSLDARQLIRQRAFDSGFWPPQGGMQYLRRFSSSIYLPASFSPLS